MAAYYPAVLSSDTRRHMTCAITRSHGTCGCSVAVWHHPQARDLRLRAIVSCQHSCRSSGRGVAFMLSVPHEDSRAVQIVFPNLAGALVISRIRAAIMRQRGNNAMRRPRGSPRDLLCCAGLLARPEVAGCAAMRCAPSACSEWCSGRGSHVIPLK